MSRVVDFPRNKRRPAVTITEPTFGQLTGAPQRIERGLQGRSRFAVQQLFEAGKIDLTEFAVLHRLIDYAGNNDIRPAMSKLAGSRRTAHRVIKRLVAKGYVQRIQRRVDGRKITNRYHLKLPGFLPDR